MTDTSWIYDAEQALADLTFGHHRYVGGYPDLVMVVAGTHIVIAGADDDGEPDLEVIEPDDLEVWRRMASEVPSPPDTTAFFEEHDYCEDQWADDGYAPTEGVLRFLVTHDAWRETPAPLQKEVRPR